MIIVFMLAIIGLNIVDWWFLRLAFLRGRPVWSGVLLALMVMMLFTPLWTRLFWSPADEPRFFVQTGWTWLAVSFWMFSAFMVVALWNLASYLLCIVHKSSVIPEATPKVGALIAIGFVVLAVIWGLIEAAAIEVKTVEIAVPKLPEGMSEYRITLLSDVHVGPACPESRLRKTIELVNGTKPDLILSAGDLIDGHGERELQLSSMLAEMKSSSGLKLAVYGNHDAYSGLEFSRKCHDAAEFRLLVDDCFKVNDVIYVHGKNDPAARKPSHEPDTVFPVGSFPILLYHRPDVPASNPQGFRLQCSGHSHGGQIFPFNFLVRIQYPHKEGRLIHIDGGPDLYVSRGTGLWGPPFRFLARPEITVFVLKAGKG